MVQGCNSTKEFYFIKTPGLNGLNGELEKSRIVAKIYLREAPQWKMLGALPD